MVKIRGAGAVSLVLAALLWPVPAAGFGKNKVNYETFDWKVYHAPHFDIYYYPEEESSLQDMVRYAESAYLQLSKALDHEVKVRIPLIYFLTHMEFEQTNITLAFIPEAVGAFAEPLENRMVLPIDMAPDELYALVVHELTHIFEYSILFQGQLRRSFRANPPLWLMEGLAEHLSGSTDSLNAMVIRDAVVNNIVPPITRLNALSFLTYRFGQAAFEYIEEAYGNEGIRNLLFEYRKVLLTNNVGKAVKDTFGVDAEEFDRRFQHWLRKRYLPILLERKAPQDYGREIGFQKPGVFTFSPSLSPSGELMAVLSTRYEDVDVLVVTAKDGKKVRNLTKGFTTDYESIITEVFSGENDLSWSPTGDNVAFFARKENDRLLFVVNALNGKRVKRVKVPVDQVASPSFSPDGGDILFSGSQQGQRDIFRLNLESETLTNVTQDAFYDMNPRWSPDGRTAIYNRRIGSYEKVFLVDLDDPSLKTQLTFGEHRDLQPSYSLDGNEIYFVSDGNDERIFNVYSLDLETGELRRWTDMVGGNFTPLELQREEGARTLAVTTYAEGRYRLFRMMVEEPVDTIRPEDREYEPVEVEEFEPPLKLTLDEDQKKDYRLKWHFEGNPTVLVGIADDGTVLTNAQIQFTDLMGDHRIIGNFYSVSTFSNFDIVYVNLKKRWDWFAEALDLRDYYVVGTEVGGDQRVREARRLTGLQAGVIYPFNRTHRISLSLGAFQRSLALPFQRDISGDGVPDVIDFQEFSGSYPLLTGTFTGDNVRFKPGVGPWQGRRYDFTVSYAPASSGDFGSFTNYLADWRNYQRMTSRSTFAIRILGAASNGEVVEGVTSSDVYSIGGFNQIRGFEYREFFGDRVAFMNLEMRFPFIDALLFHRNFGIPNIQGIIFFDVGGAAFRGDLVYDSNLFTESPFTPGIFARTGGFREFDFYGTKPVFTGDFDAAGDPVFKDKTGFVDGRASYGFGFNFFFGPLQLNWSFAHRLPFLETELNTRADGTVIRDPVTGEGTFRFIQQKPSGFRSSFYIGATF